MTKKDLKAAIKDCIKADVADTEPSDFDVKTIDELKDIFVGMIDGFQIVGATPEEEDAELQRRLQGKTLTLYMEIVEDAEEAEKTESAVEVEGGGEAGADVEETNADEAGADVEEVEKTEPATKKNKDNKKTKKNKDNKKTKKQTGKKKTKKQTGKKKTKKQTGKKKIPGRQVTKKSRIDAVTECLKKQAEWERAKLIEASSEVYEGWGGKANPGEQRFVTYQTVKVLTSLGLADVKDGVITYHGGVKE